jgi:thiamine biosynthesis lipoprotein
MFGLMSPREPMLFRNRCLILSILLAITVSCGRSELNADSQLFRISGNAQGTTYTIQVVDSMLNVSKFQIDSLLFDFDEKLSTYKSSSLISRFNQVSFVDTLLLKNDFFIQMLNLSDSVFRLSEGYFDPSIKPIVDLWGIGTASQNVPTKAEIDSVLLYVGFEKGKHFTVLDLDSVVYIEKKTPRLELDFNAIAQGYSVDLLIEFLKLHGHTNVYVELGGEIKLSGFKVGQQKWNIGIESPVENNKTDLQTIQNVFSITDCAIATSGNYRKYFEDNGQLYAHTINPKTGAQNRHALLSATVLSSSCALSDALATFFMVVGVEATKSFIDRNKELGIEVYLIYSEDGQYGSYCSPSLLKSQKPIN